MIRREAPLDVAIELMYFAYRGFVGEADRVLEARRLARAHHRILFFVARLKRPTVGELRRTLAVSKQSLAGPLRDLKRQDLIAWQPDPGDARVRRLALTPAGRALERRLSTLQRRQFSRVFADAGAPQAAAWRAVMLRLARDELERSGRELA
jgi:DNA-binding MarR family transcriptional regulator